MNNIDYGKANKLADLLYRTFDGEKKTHTEVVDTAKKLAPVIGLRSEGEDIASFEAAIGIYETEVGIRAYDPYILAKDKKASHWLYKKKDTIPHPFFKRYRNYLRSDGFSISAIDKIESVCEKVLSFCADPLSGCEVRKRGLVVGDVQSGKTANYLALINMAYDYGYKIVVLLAGTTDSLRLQTQKRTDAGVIGAVSDTIGNEIQYCGVGLINKEHYAIPFTNRENDFAKFIQKNLNATINDFKKPVVLVVKKNKKILESVIERLQPALRNYGSNSLLIIDDEADNASVNTAKPDKDPTAINRCIRGILNSFPIASYVGFTATPFANIFINPEDDPEYMDLFPADFIVQLNSPDNYFGGRKVFSDEANLRPIRIINAKEKFFLSPKHKKEDIYPGMPDSMKEAVLCFLLNNVIRTLRGHGQKHRTMMINISVYNLMHSQIKSHVQAYVDKLKNVIEQDSAYPTERFVKNEDMKKLYDLFASDDFYDEVRNGTGGYRKISWDEIQAGLYDEIKLFETVIVNSRTDKGDKFDYEDYKETGARVIVIGGYVLSRGLTLEGLMISYYGRNAGSYDTALQMCRWFGYRPGYEDLCRVYISEVNVSYFNAVLDAVEDLKDQFAEMERQGKKPIDFGLMVKESPDSLETKLLITARNKLRYTDELVYHLSYGGVYADTSKLSKDPSVNLHNLRSVEEFVGRLTFSKVGSRYMARGVSKLEIADVIRNLKIPYVNKKFDTDGLSEYIEKSDVFYLWDVVIATGESKEIPNFMGAGPASTRSFRVYEDETYLRIGGANNRVLDPNIFDSGLLLTDEQKAEILSNKSKSGNKKTDSLSALDYLKIRENPIFVIYPLDLITKADVTTGEDDKKRIKAAFDGKPLLAFAIGFPAKESQQKLNYRINKVKIKQLEINDEPEDDDDGDNYDD